MSSNQNMTFQSVQIGGVTREATEAVAKLADVLIANAEAVKQLALSIKCEFQTGIHLGDRNE